MAWYNQWQAFSDPDRQEVLLLRKNHPILFLGTAPFAVPSLDLLVKEKFNLAGVVTRPDRPAGRGHKTVAGAVKALAMEKGLPLYQPFCGAELETLISKVLPHLLVNVAHGMFLTRKALALPPLGAINLHPSLLPAYRGAAPIQRALLAGENVTGVTVLYMAPRMDAGDIIIQQKMEIGPGEDCGALYARLSVLGAEKLVEALDLVISGKAPRRPQVEEMVTYAPALSREDEMIEWAKTATSISDRVRALAPSPGAYTVWRGKRLKIWRVSPVGGVLRHEKEPGTVFTEKDGGLYVITGEGAIQIFEVQPEGKRRMKVEDFLRGHQLEEGERLG